MMRLRSSFALPLLAAVVAAAPAHAGTLTSEVAWTTYHHDAERSGSDPYVNTPVMPALSWQSPDLGAPIWGQPLIVGSRAYVATVGDDVYALDTTTGHVVWHASAGTPVPSSALPCGDITPSVGIVGTPVIDPANGIIYAVADTWNGSQAQHLLEGFRITNGEKVLSTVVDPSGAEPKTLLQRAALNLDNGNVIFGFGGNDGDCGKYLGAVASVPESGGAPAFFQVPIKSSAPSGGAVWATGGPAVDSAGTVFASTGNPNPPSGERASTYDYSDSILQLNPSMSLTGHFEPPTWEEDSNSDRDLGSVAPELLPGGLVFQAGKDGTGYLVNEAAMSAGAAAVYSHEVCAGAGSFGGDSYSNGVIYIPCTNGVQALSYNAAARTFTGIWQGPSDAVGSPIVSGGLVWVAATGGSKGGGTKLYGLDAATGAARYTETLPSPIADHFASRSAGGGHVFLATGSTVSAYQVAVLSTEAPVAPVAPAPVAAPPPASAHPGISLRLPALLHRHLHAGRKGKVKLLLRCPTRATCAGTVTISATLGSKVLRPHHHRVSVHARMIRVTFGAHHGRFTLTLHLDRRARALLRRHHRRLHVVLTFSLPGSPARHVDALLTGSR